MKKTELKLEYLKRVIEMINNKGLNQDCYNFKYGDETPISSKVFKIMPNGIIILSEEVYYALLKVHELTITKIREIPFFLYGTEIANNQIYFDDFCIQTKKLFKRFSLYTESMYDDLAYEIDYHQRDNLVVCKGHSHPSMGSLMESFSLNDLAGDMQFKKDNSIFKMKKIEVVSCLVTPSKDINFLYYDDKTEDFYRFGKVLVKNNKNMYYRINCYGDGKQDILVKTIKR